MKRYIAIFIALIAAFLVVFTGCHSNTTTEVTATQKYFEATVLSANTDYLLVEPAEGTTERNTADQIEIEIADIGEEDSLLYLRQAAAGDKIQIGYLGDILETYPAKINNVFKISLIE